MTLTARVESLTLPLTEPLVTGHGVVSVRHSTVVALADNEHVGWGEAAPLPGWHRGDGADLAPTLISALARVSRDDGVDAAVAGLGDPFARAAVAGAWADLRARRAGVALARWLDPSSREVVPVSSLVTGATVAAVEEETRAAVVAGYGTIKIKVGGRGPEIDVQRVRAARAVGPELSVRLDANRAWDRVTAESVLTRVEPLDVAWCEEPTADPAEFAVIEARTGVPIAVDETVVTASALRRALNDGVTVVVVKPQVLGGPDRALEAVGAAEAAGATVVVTSYLDSAIGVAHALQVAATVAGPVAHGLATSDRLRRDVGPVPRIERGMMRVPTAPGLGFDPVL